MPMDELVGLCTHATRLASAAYKQIHTIRGSCIHGYRQCPEWFTITYIPNNNSYPLSKSSHQCGSPARIKPCPIYGHSKLSELWQSQFGGQETSRLARGPGKPRPKGVCGAHGGGRGGWPEDPPFKRRRRRFGATLPGVGEETTSVTTSHRFGGPPSRHNEGVPSPFHAFWM